MVWYIRTLEIIDSGKYRLTVTSDEGGGGPFGLCDHEHDTREEARECEEAKTQAEMY